MSIVPLVAPTTTDARMDMLCKRASSFVYCVAVTGVTGKRSSLPVDLTSYLARVRSVTDLPVAVGFGISNRDHFLAVDKLADGVVIGSAIIRQVADPGEGRTTAQAAEDFARSITQD
mmetsp:Transcript_42790/g.107992  ORF Transcript_42790/g.107992 Transcript_42790/m.107992 type:complete len:117 (+) Transcript_42790:867-1217(+)